MKIVHMLLALALILGGAGVARADIEQYLARLDVHAAADFGAFRAGLGAHFGASGTELDLVLSNVRHPGEAAVCFWLRQHSRQPLEVVLQGYREQRGQGWGALAKNLGIKPGSAEFHALKAGQLGWYPAGAGEPAGRKEGKNHGKGKGKDK